MITVAIIDNGISMEHIQVPAEYQAYDVDEAGYIHERKVLCKEMTHGSLCAAIILKYNIKIKLIDIKALNMKGKGSVIQLRGALKWCVQENVDIVHMSLGVVNYHDVLIIEPIIKKLIDKGKILVAAHHNQGIRGYPASREGVFGIRSVDISGVEKSIYISSDADVPVENRFMLPADKTIIGKGGEIITLDSGNSYAAAGFTAEILKIIDGKNTVDRGNVLEELINIGKSNNDITINYRKKTLHEKEIKIPVIAFFDTDVKSFRELYKIFCRQGYSVEGVVDFEESEYIPINYYIDYEKSISSKISKKLLNVLIKVYEPDIIIFCLKEGRYPVLDLYEIVDIFIEKQSGNIVLYNKLNSWKVNDIQTAYEKIVNIF